MALTQSARIPGPSWDETIVPALRKRLQSESRTLSKRMSAVSLEEAFSPNPSIVSDSTIRERATSPNYSDRSQHSTTIPRPGWLQGRSSSDGPASNQPSRRINGTNSPRPLPTQRSRTYSQPYKFDPNIANNRAKVSSNAYTNGTSSATINPELPRAASPYHYDRSPDIKPTRIPKARGRTASTSSQGHSQLHASVRADSRNGYSPSVQLSPDPSTDLWAVTEAAPSNYSRSTVSVASRQLSGLLNEPAPFTPGSLSSAGQSQSHEQTYGDPSLSPPRASTESEDRPFEHWYRGEVSRNGGVGELRVGKRMEMLEIANYGHTLRKPSPRPTMDSLGILDAHADTRRRKRADSVAGVGARESFYMDEEGAQEVGRVLDEHPLTDLDADGDGEDDVDMESDPEDDHTTSHSYLRHGENGGASTPLSSFTQEYRSHTPTSHRPSSRQQNGPPTRIPAPAPRQSSEPPRTAIPTQIARGASEPPFPSTSTNLSPLSMQDQQNIPRSASQPHAATLSKAPLQSGTSTPKRRAKSPPVSSSTSKKTKTNAKAMSRKQMEDDANRRSVAHYPTPADEDNIIDAIPSWTQPVPSGNWDEVVLPVVARKKGLDGHYQHADGSPQPKKVEHIVEPAPGTFGFDHSKYRPPRDVSIPMDEFGRPTKIEEQDEPPAGSPNAQPEYRSKHDETLLPVRRQQPSPVPFAHYTSTNTMSIPQLDPNMLQEKEEEHGAGCCKCVIM